MTLHPIVSPISDFEHAEKGDALYGIYIYIFYTKKKNTFVLD